MERRQRHQNPDMGYTHRKSAAVSTSKQTRKTLELLGLATIVRIVLMYYLNLEKFLNQPDADLKIMLAEASGIPSRSS